MSTITSKYDWLGIMSASLCSIHCIATPFIVLLQASDLFHALSYPFLVLSFFGAIEGTKHSESRKVLQLVWGGFSILLVSVVLEDVSEHLGKLSYLMNGIRQEVIFHVNYAVVGPPTQHSPILLHWAFHPKASAGGLAGLLVYQ